MLEGVRVVVTGLGAVTSFGVGLAALWQGLREGVSGIDWITTFDVTGWPVRYAGEVKSFAPERHLVREAHIRQERSVPFGLVAAAEALTHARLVDEQQLVGEDQPAIGVVVGSGLGPCGQAEASYRYFFEAGWKAVRPTTVPKSMFNSLSSHLSIHFGLRGGNHVVAAACASGTIAIGQAYHLIKSGQESVVLCGGADSPLCPSMYAAWSNMNVLARHEDPRRASRPFDRHRNGLVLSEGAAIIVLESSESAERRGVKPLAEVVGYGASSDAHHVTAPQVAGQELSMRRCLDSAGVAPSDVDYINAHGTSTEQNDQAEAAAIRGVFGDHPVAVSSTKSMTGHALGASGAIECAACVQAMQSKFIPPTLNCDEPDPDIGLDYVPYRGRAAQLNYVMSNSFGFGGSNATLLLRSLG